MQTITGPISCDGKIVHGAGFKMAGNGETKMRKRSPLTSNLQRIFFILLGVIVLGGGSKTAPLPDGIRVTSSSEVCTTAAKSLMPPCNNPAEFGRCGCFLDGLRTSCDVVSRCLEAGFCKVAQSQPANTNVTSESEIFTTAARSLSLIPGYCAPEFRSCSCSIDGIVPPAVFFSTTATEAGCLRSSS